jgi:hypothetical protein
VNRGDLLSFERFYAATVRREAAKRAGHVAACLAHGGFPVAVVINGITYHVTVARAA